MSKEDTISKMNIYEGAIIKLDLHEVVLENKNIAKREIISHNGGVGVLPIDKDGQVVLVRQFRKPFECETLEIPAGKRDRAERAEKCAERELLEETGITAGKMKLLLEMYPSPGYTNETVFIFEAEELSYGTAVPDEDEFIELFRCSLEEAYSLVKSGGIKDAKTIIAITMAVNERLRKI